MTCSTDAVLLVTDGTTKVDLLRGPVRLDSWRPAVAPYKAGGVYQDNPMADGRALLFARLDNINETMSIKAHAETPDSVILFIETLQALLQKAANYGRTTWQNQPVWLEARARNETNIRYALIISGSIPELEDPYRQPFRQPGGRAVMDRLTLNIEHGLWRSHKPGEAGCAELYVRPDLDRQAYADKILDTVPFACWPLTETSGTVAYNISRGGSGMNGTHDTVTLDNFPFTNGDPTPFYDLGAGNTQIRSTPLSSTGNWRKTGTIMAWIRTDSGIIWDDGNEHWIIRLGTSGNDEIDLYKSTTNDQIVFIYRANDVTTTTSHILSSAVNETGWIPITATWEYDEEDESVILRLYVAGWQRDYAYGLPHSQIEGVLTSSETVIGAKDNTGTDSFSADICYVTIWDRVLSQSEVVALHKAPSPVDDESSCEDIVFVANKNFNAKLTHIYYYDASTTGWSSNLLEGDPPYDILPAVPAVGDIVYFGVSTGTPVILTGTFNNLVFDFDDEAGNGFTGVWEYRNTSLGGSWDSIAVTTPFWLMDHTAGLLAEGVSSVHWDTLTGWGTSNLNTIFGGSAPDVGGFWVRFRVTTATSGLDSPTQQNRHVYTCTSGYLDVNPDSLTGTLPALITLELRNQKQSPTSTNDNIGRLFLGSRSVHRGELFSAYLNLVDAVFNIPGVSLTYGTDTTEDSGVAEAPAWRAATYRGGAGASYVNLVTLNMDGDLAPSYYGRYRLFLRYRATNMTGAVTDLRIKVDSAGTFYTPSVHLTQSSDSDTYTVADFGTISLGPADLLHPDERMVSIGLAIQGKESGTATHIIYFYDFVLIPVDEWAGEFRAPDRADALVALDAVSSDDRSKLVVDSATLPKRAIRAYNEYENTQGIISFWQSVNRGEAFINTGRQRLWLLALSDYSSDVAPAVGQRGKSCIVMRAKLRAVNRYIEMRGNK